MKNILTTKYNINDNNLLVKKWGSGTGGGTGGGSGGRDDNEENDILNRQQILLR